MDSVGTALCCWERMAVLVHGQDRNVCCICHHNSFPGLFVPRSPALGLFMETSCVSLCVIHPQGSAVTHRWVEETLIFGKAEECRGYSV